MHIALFRVQGIEVGPVETVQTEFGAISYVREINIESEDGIVTINLHARTEEGLATLVDDTHPREQA